MRRHIGRDLLVITGVVALLWDADGRLFLTRRHDDGLWGLPGGIADPGEPPAQVVVRELREELGLLVRPTRLAGVLGGEEFRHTYPNGDVAEITLVFLACDLLEGTPALLDGEVTDWGYFPVDALPPLVQRYPLELLARRGEGEPPYFQWQDGWLTT
jgi:8-oxo-dGTP pyrophosphatase MutT (NUDIX family)